MVQLDYKNKKVFVVLKKNTEEWQSGLLYLS